LPMDGFKSLRGNTQGIRNSYSNSLGTDVQT
jgi:hypothetical protein